MPSSKLQQEWPRPLSAMNDTYGRSMMLSRAEAASEMADERAKALSKQFIMDMHTHFLRDDTRLENFVRARETVGKAGWNPAWWASPRPWKISSSPTTSKIFLDSDTKVAGLSGAPSDVPQDWFLTNEMKAEAPLRSTRKLARAGCCRRRSSRRGRRMAGAGRPGDEELKPDSFKGYTIGDNTNKHLSKYPWRMDDEQVVYPFYEKCLKAGLVNITVHKVCSRPRSSRDSRTC